jgi:hypothetical protein
MPIRYDKFGLARRMKLGCRLWQSGIMLVINSTSTRLLHIKAVYSLEWNQYVSHNIHYRYLKTGYPAYKL